MAVQARILQGRVELSEPIPEDWEGRTVKITMLMPDDPNPELDSLLAALHSLGPIEMEQDERENIMAAMSQLNQASQRAMESLAGCKS